jgi:uncharacterized protein
MSDAQYEPGDVNSIEPATPAYDEDDYEPGDVNAIAPGEPQPDDRLGNQATGGTPTAVLDYLARSLADEPDSVVVEAESRGSSVRLRVHVGPQDMGRVIGRRGRTAQALRTLVAAAGARDGVQTNVDIVDA